MKLHKKHAYLLLPIFILILISLGFFLIYEQFRNQTAQFQHIPKNVRVTNISDKAFTISWKTEEPTKGLIIYQEDKFDTNLPPVGGKIAIDDRDYYQNEIDPRYQFGEAEVLTYEDIANQIIRSDREVKKYYTHHVTVRNLEPEKTYHFLLSDGTAYGIDNTWFADDEFTHPSTGNVTTLILQESFNSPHPAYGDVVSALTEDVNEGLSFINIQYQDDATGKDNFIPISAPLSQDGVWYMDISSIRSTDGTLTKFDPMLHFGRVFVDTGYVGRSINYNVPPYEDSPTKPIEVFDELPEGYNDETQSYTNQASVPTVAGLGTPNQDESYSDPEGVIDNNCTGSGGSIGRCDQNHQDGNYYLCTENGWKRVASCTESSMADGGDEASLNPGGSDQQGAESSYAEYDWSNGPPKEFFYNPDISNYNGPPPGTSDYFFDLNVQDDPATWGFNGVENARNGGPGSGCNGGRTCATGLSCKVCGSDTYEGQKGERLNLGTIQLCVDPSRDLSLQCGGFRRTLDTTPFDYNDDPVQTPWQYTSMAVHCPSDEIAEKIINRCTDNFYNNADRCIEECHAINDGCQSTNGRLVRNCCRAGAITTDPMCDPNHFLYCPEACPNGNPFPDEMRAPFSDQSIAWQEENNIKMLEGGTGLGGRVPVPQNGDWQPDELVTIISEYGSENSYEEIAFKAEIEEISFIDKFVVQVKADEKLLLEPKEGVIFVEKAGTYCVDTQEGRYCADITEPGMKKLFLDQNGDELFDANDILLSEGSNDLIELTLDEEYFQRSLVRGLNLISLNLLKENGEQFKAAELLELINEKYDAPILSIATYDNSLGRWLIVGSNHGSTFKSIDFNIIPGKGYLIKSEDSMVFSIEKATNVSVDTIYVGEGWNLVSIPNKNFVGDEKPSQLLLNIFNGFDQEIFADNLSQWNRSVAKYEGVSIEYDENSQSIFGRDFALNTHSAYFIRISGGRGSWTY